MTSPSSGLPFNRPIFSSLLFTGLVLAISVSIAPTARADKNAKIGPKIASLGTAVVEESFDSQIAPPWVPAKGEWKVIKGVLAGIGLTVAGSHAKLDTEKPNYRFVMRGDSLSIDDLHIWDVQ